MGKHKRPTQDELLDREQRRRTAAAELKRLKEHWPELRRTQTAEALALAWFLYGDAMFVGGRDG